MFVPYVSEIWTKSYGSNYGKFRAFLTKKVFFNNFFTKRWRQLRRRFCSVAAETLVQCYMLVLFIWRLTSFSVPKTTVSKTISIKVSESRLTSNKMRLYVKLMIIIITLISTSSFSKGYHALGNVCTIGANCPFRKSSGKTFPFLERFSPMIHCT